MIPLAQLTPTHAYGDEVALDMGDGLTVLVRWQAEEPEWLDIMMIESSRRGEGLASKALNELCCFADARNLSLSLYARMCDGGSLDTRQLAEWYGRFGFDTSQSYLPSEAQMSDPDHIGVDMWRSPKPLSIAA